MTSQDALKRRDAFRVGSNVIIVGEICYIVRRLIVHFMSVLRIVGLVTALLPLHSQGIRYLVYDAYQHAKWE